MAKQVATPASFFGNDVKSLFSHCGVFSKKAEYRELVREDAAYHAVCRWPLLAELQGLHFSDTDKAK